MWKIIFISEAKTDLSRIDESSRRQILAGIRKVSKNPLPVRAGGYGKPLGNYKGNNLTGFYKIKFKRIGVRVIYTLDMSSLEMIIITISKRDKNHCYLQAEKRKSYSKWKK